jgi:histidine ammonia-lyase
LISAAQAKDFNIIKSSKVISEFLKKLRVISPKISNDKIMFVEIKKVNKFIKNYKIKNLFL